MREAIQKLIDITFADAESSRDGMIGKRLAHYTSADTVAKMSTSQALWLRNLRGMNDFKEVVVGDEIWRHTFTDDEEGAGFRRQLCELYPSLNDFFDKELPQKRELFLKSSYASSLSVHPGRQEDDDAEARFGRLSMWRAYAPRDGAALLVNPQGLLVQKPDEPPKSQLLIVPMNYVEPSRPIKRAAEVIQAFQEIQGDHSPRKLPLWEWFLSVWYYLTLATSKHIAFREEQEWRILWSGLLIDPWGLPADDDALRLTPRVFAGQPEEIMIVDLVALADRLPGVLPHLLVDEVLIGPSNHPEIMKDIVADALLFAGVEDADERVRIADIPLRTP